MIESILFVLVFLPIVWVIMVIFHEVGHAIALKLILKEKVPIKWGFNQSETGTDEQMSKLTLVQYKRVLLLGVLTGSIPLFFIYHIFSWWINFLLFYGYLWVCMSDLKELKRKK